MSTERENKVVNPDCLRDAADDPCCRERFNFINLPGRKTKTGAQTDGSPPTNLCQSELTLSRRRSQSGSAGNVRRFPP